MINLIQIKESVAVILPIFSVVFTHFIFSYAFDMFSSRENQGYYEFKVHFHPRVVDSKLITLHNTHRRALYIHRQQTICWTSAQTKLSSIYRHKHIVIYCALLKHQASLTIQEKLKLAIKLIITFLLFGRDTLWRIPRKRVERGGKL